MCLLRLELPSELASISEARAALSDLAGHVPTAVLPNLRLLVSEVVTNAVRHTGSGTDARVVLLVAGCPGGVRIEVHDHGSGFDTPADPQPSPEGTSGWGLFLVQKIARRWGTERGPDSHVWFELATA